MQSSPCRDFASPYKQAVYSEDRGWFYYADTTISSYKQGWPGNLHDIQHVMQGLQESLRVQGIHASIGVSIKYNICSELKSEQ